MALVKKRGPGEMAKHEDLGLDTQHPHKSET